MSSESPHRLSASRSPDWLDEIIEEARERGDFDDLPGHGRPLTLPPESSAPSEYDLAFTMLSNAGFAPWWMELGKEADRLEHELAEFRTRASAEIALLRNELELRVAPGDRETSARSWFRRLLNGSATSPATSRPLMTPEQVERRRLVLRRQHQDQADKLDAKLATYQAAMPRDLWHVQRERPTPEAWAAMFDAACPPITASPPESHSSSTPLTNDRE